MRDYGRISPNFWTGETGKAIKAHGPEAVIMAIYLMTSPLSNMLGMYYQPILYAAHETGLGFEGASKGLARCIDAGFCLYDHPSEMVWVVEMAKYQIAKHLKADDKRCLGIQKDYSQLPDNPFLEPFFDRYCSDFHLKEKRRSRRPFEAPSKQLTGAGAIQEQEQEQAQEQEQDISPANAGGGQFACVWSKPEPPKPINGRPKVTVEFAKVVELYHEVLTPPLPRVEKLTDKRKGQIRQRWEQDLPSVEAWRNFFDDVAASAFLMGRVPGNNGRPPFRADLEWITNSTNFTAIAEGKYHR
jgi:hypothetical protein